MIQRSVVHDLRAWLPNLLSRIQLVLYAVDKAYIRGRNVLQSVVINSATYMLEINSPDVIYVRYWRTAHHEDLGAFVVVVAHTHFLLQRTVPSVTSLRCLTNESGTKVNSVYTPTHDHPTHSVAH